MLFEGYVYMTSIDTDSDVMGVVVRRMWWKPWKFNLQLLLYPKQMKYGYMSREGPTVKNLTKLGVAGMMKMYGVCTDFSEFLGEPK